MPELKIDPKFNIHETYKRVNIVNPYRHGSGGSSPSGYEPETIMFMDATSTPDDSTASIYTGLTNNDCWNLLDSVIKYLKSNNGWDGIIHWHPMFGGTKDKHKHNIKNLGVFDCEFVLDWICDSTGNIPVSSSAYARFNFTPASYLSFEDSGFSLAVLSDTSSGLELGGNSGTNNRTYIQARDVTNCLVRIGDTSAGSFPNANAIGIYTSVRKDGAVKVVKDGVEKTNTSGGGTGLSNVQSYYGAYNNNGSVSLFSKKKLGSMMHHTGDNELIINEALRMWEQGLGRI